MSVATTAVRPSPAPSPRAVFGAKNATEPTQPEPTPVPAPLSPAEVVELTAQVAQLLRDKYGISLRAAETVVAEALRTSQVHLLDAAAQLAVATRKHRTMTPGTLREVLGRSDDQLATLGRETFRRHASERLFPGVPHHDLRGVFTLALLVLSTPARTPSLTANLAALAAKYAPGQV